MRLVLWIWCAYDLRGMFGSLGTEQGLKEGAESGGEDRTLGDSQIGLRNCQPEASSKV